MKFSWKILLCTMLIMAAACGASGYFFVNYVFQTSMERETRQALDESSILRFAFETAALNIPSKYDVLPDGTVEQIGVYLENSGQHGNRLLRISDENGKVLYVSEGFTGDTSLWEERGENTRVYRVVQSGDSYYIQTQTRINVSDRLLTLETMKNVTAVYTERTEGFRMYRQVTVIVLLCSGAVMTLIACWLTRPIRLLTQATGKMAEGEYSYRAEQISNDEMGQLTADFNHMAEALEQNIQNLENEVRAREDFIAAFSHELKTPLTAIIGYADMLRSRKLDDEKHFLCANYIYTEGKRLETMALRLLDIIVTRRKEIDRKTTNVSGIFSYLQEIYDETKNPEDGRVKVDICWEKGELYAEENLLKTVLINLTDNAIKASEEGQTVEITGRRMENGYYFQVRDEGIGIPEEELHKITEAFYMVDKKGIRIKDKELIFKYGTVESFKSQYFDKEKNLSFDYYNVKGDSNGKQLFEFFATNTSVEWSQLLLGKNETNGLNIISTSHMNDTEKGIIFLYNKQYKYGYTIRGHIHNHFQNKNPSSNDVENAKIISHNHQMLGRKIPFFKIFIPKNQEYTDYNKNSVPAELLQEK